MSDDKKPAPASETAAPKGPAMDSAERPKDWFFRVARREDRKSRFIDMVRRQVGPYGELYLPKDLTEVLLEYMEFQDSHIDQMHKKVAEMADLFKALGGGK